MNYELADEIVRHIDVLAYHNAALCLANKENNTKEADLMDSEIDQIKKDFVELLVFKK